MYHTVVIKVLFQELIRNKYNTSIKTVYTMSKDEISQYSDSVGKRLIIYVCGMIFIF